MPKSKFDLKIGASLLDPDNPPENFTDVQKLLSFTPLYTIATECTLQKTAWYMTLLKDCWAKLYGMLVEDALWKVFVEIEMKLVPVIAGKFFLLEKVRRKMVENIINLN